MLKQLITFHISSSTSSNLHNVKIMWRFLQFFFFFFFFSTWTFLSFYLMFVSMNIMKYHHHHPSIPLLEQMFGSMLNKTENIFSWNEIKKFLCYWVCLSYDIFFINQNPTNQRLTVQHYLDIWMWYDYICNIHGMINLFSSTSCTLWWINMNFLLLHCKKKIFAWRFPLTQSHIQVSQFH